MKPQTAANKLGIYLPAAPEEFQGSPISRQALDEMRANPPPWLEALRRNGPFPRDVVAQKLGISRAGLSRSDVNDALSADEIGQLLADPPEWMVRERKNYADVVTEKERVKAKQTR